MSYAPNVVSKDDLIYINGVAFKVKKDFNLIKGDRKLVLELDNRPKQHVYSAQVNNNVKHKQLQQAKINCIDCKFYEHDEEFILSYCSLDGESVIDASKYGCEVGEQRKKNGNERIKIVSDCSRRKLWQ